MLIIFDLDDTLVETSKCLTTKALERAYLAMQSAGLEGGDFSTLVNINQSSISSQVALKKYLNPLTDDEAIFEIGKKALQSPLLGDVCLDPVPGAIELLADFEVLHDLVLVTLGSKELQMQKMEKAGIEPSIFSRLVVESGRSKKPIYQEILSEKGINPSEVIVCGDRVPIDLSPGKECGFTTVHLKNGRGAFHTAPEKDVDYTIEKLEELKKVIL